MMTIEDFLRGTNRITNARLSIEQLATSTPRVRQIVVAAAAKDKPEAE